MKSVVLQLDSDAPAPAALSAALRAAASGEGAPGPSLILGFLPPGAGASGLLPALGEAFPDAVRLGCEAVTQFAGGAVTGAGSLQLFWLERPGHGVEVTVLRGERGSPLDPDQLDRAAAVLSAADAAFLLVDGLRFPVSELLELLRERAA